MLSTDAMELLVTLLLLSLGCSAGLKTHVEHGQGFLVKHVKPHDSKHEVSKENDQIYIYGETTATKLVSQHSDMTAEYNISYDLNSYSNTDPLSLRVYQHPSGANITAHVVHRTVTDTSPMLHVLIHSDAPLPTAQCSRIHVRRQEGEVLLASCELWRSAFDGTDGSEALCMASVSLPYSWWSTGQVYVSFEVVSKEMCSYSPDDIRSRPEKDMPQYYVSDVELKFDDRDSQREITEDQHVSISLPDKPQEPNSQFSSIVKLHSGSPLSIFIIRVTPGDGLSLSSCWSADPSLWTLQVDTIGSGATIRAFSRNSTQQHPKGSKVQEVIVCQFEVSSGAVKTEADITWQIEYESTFSGELYYDRGNRQSRKTVSTRVRIAKSDEVLNLVAVVKTHDMISLRRFTNSVATQPVWVYAIDRSGKLSKINSQARCMSSRKSVLQISKLCDTLYLSGESDDPGIIEVYFDYAGLTLALEMRVWFPDVETIIKLDDDRLNEIRGWKVQAEKKQPGLSGKPECHLQYQATNVRVFTRFYSVYERRIIYMRGGKVAIYSDITSLVQPLISSSDEAVAQYESGVVRGVSPGTAHLKVVSPQGQVLTTVEVKVVNTKVSVDMLHLDFVSNIGMDVVEDGNLPGVLTANYYYDRKLSDKHPEGMLEVWTQFTDGTVAPLSHYANLSYKLEIENETPDVLVITGKKSWQFIRVGAVGSGLGSLRVSLFMDDLCLRKHSQSLAVSSVSIDVDFTKPPALFVNDAAYKDHIPLLADSPKQGWQPVIMTAKDRSKYHSDQGAIAGQSKQDPLAASDNLTPLQTGMFVLMGVLGVVASVFVTNCLIYIYRQQKGQQPVTKDAGVEKVTSGWVWLDKNTLEENAIATTPEPFLSERDFQKRCSRSDSLQSRVSKHSSSGTYRGSECSIRITANPRASIREGVTPGRLSEVSSDSEDDIYCSPKLTIGIAEPEKCSLLSEEYDLPAEHGDSDMELDYNNTFIVHKEGEGVKKPVNLTQLEFDNLRESIA